jgi:chemotaxis family two-component system response regulator Rcp1
MDPESIPRPMEILLVEDSPTDALMAKIALTRLQERINVHMVEDGIEAEDFLHRRGQYAEAPRPDLILLDLNLPRKDGRELLTEIKADDRLKSIPVVILTTSKSEDDILEVYELHASSYIVKPVDYPQFAEVVRIIDRYWFTVVTLPGR